MDSITKPLTLQLKKIANFIALEGENKECYWFALILTIYALIGDCLLYTSDAADD